DNHQWLWTETDGNELVRRQRKRTQALSSPSSPGKTPGPFLCGKKKRGEPHAGLFSPYEAIDQTAEHAKDYARCGSEDDEGHWALLAHLMKVGHLSARKHQKQAAAAAPCSDQCAKGHH